LSLAITNPSSLNGVFTNPDGNAIQYVPNAPYSDTSRYDPAGTSAYDNIYARHSDGTNASPFVVVRVLSYSHDTFFTTSDGIPENWMIYYFGNADPTSGSNHLATDDFDGDTINNLDEYRSGMNPTNNNSAQRVTMLNSSTNQWQARAFDLYEIQGSSDLITWPFILPVVPTNATIDLRTDLFATNIIAVASNLPTNSPKMFYRVQRVP
jgi:hypothetical protein